MQKKLKRYTVDGLESEVYAISVVEYPAIESDFIALNKQKCKTVLLESEEKRMLYGPVLIPDLPIYRYDEATDFEYEVVFSKKAIEQLSQRYMRHLNNANWTMDHEQDAPGLFTAESWIKESLSNDKSISLGLDPNLPVGTWFAGCKVDNDETWQRVKRGDFSGFSIESFVKLDEINLSSYKTNEENMTEFINENFWTKLKEVFAEVLNDKVEEEVVEQPETGVELEENAVVEEEPAKEEELVEESAEQEDAVEEEETPEAAEELEAKTNLEDENKKLMDQVKELQEQVTKLLEKNAELSKQNEKLSALPSAEPVKVDAEKAQNPFDIIRSLHDGTYKK